MTDLAPLVDEARARPSWARLVRDLETWALARQDLLAYADEIRRDIVEGEADARAVSPELALELFGGEGEGEAETAAPDLRRRIHAVEDLYDPAVKRARALAGTLAPRAFTAAERTDLAARLLEAAEVEARARLARRAGNDRRPHPGVPALPESPTPPAPDAPRVRPASVDLTGRERREINLVAQAIHRRYLVPSSRLRDPHDAPPDPVRTEINAAIREGIALAMRDEGGSGAAIAATPQPKRHAPAQAMRESRALMVQSAMQACAYLHLGDVEAARAHADLALGYRVTHQAASRAVEKTAARTATGRFFRGDVFSVRQYVDVGEPGQDRPFWQRYFRLTLMLDEDGITLKVVNGPVLEHATGVDVGEDGWSDLARWIEDHTDRRDHKRRGRRVENDAELVYRLREDEERYELRATVRDRYPGLVRALECLRQAMYTSDVEAAILPEDRPAPGYHVPPPDEDEEGGEADNVQNEADDEEL